MTNQAFEVIEKSLKSSHLLSNPKQADSRTLVIYRVWTNLLFLPGKRTSIRAYPLDPRELRRTYFHGSNGVRAIEVLLYFCMYMYMPVLNYK